MTAALEGASGQQHASAALYPWQRPGTHCTGGWSGLRASLEGRKISPTTGIRYPDCPAHSQSLYRLSYPARSQSLYPLRYPAHNFNSHLNKIWYLLYIMFHRYGVMTQSADRRLHQQGVPHSCAALHRVHRLSFFLSPTVFSSVYNTVLIVKSLFSCKPHSIRA